MILTALPSHVPAAIRACTGVGEGRRLQVGCSGADVFRLNSPSQGECYLKVTFHAAGRDERSLCGENDRLCWLGERLADAAPPGEVEASLRTPRVLAFSQTLNGAGGWTYLLTSAVPGRALHEAASEGPIRVGRLMGQSLRVLHDLDPSGCPDWRSPDTLLAEAAKNVRSGRVRPSELRNGQGDAADLLRQLQSRPPHVFEPVVCHGDFCLPNVLATLDDRCGLVDLGGVCVSDRHLDLAAAVRSLRFNGGLEDVVRVFQNWYGRDRIDDARLRWYTQLWDLL